jgi:hypothetical protein
MKPLSRSVRFRAPNRDCSAPTARPTRCDYARFSRVGACPARDVPARVLATEQLTTGKPFGPWHVETGGFLVSLCSSRMSSGRWHSMSGMRRRACVSTITSSWRNRPSTVTLRRRRSSPIWSSDHLIFLSPGRYPLVCLGPLETGPVWLISHVSSPPCRISASASKQSNSMNPRSRQLPSLWFMSREQVWAGRPTTRSGPVHSLPPRLKPDARPR